jgi:hypothetical protein
MDAKQAGEPRCIHSLHSFFLSRQKKKGIARASERSERICERMRIRANPHE